MHSSDQKPAHPALQALVADIGGVVSASDATQLCVGKVKDLLAGFLCAKPSLPQGSREPAADEYARHLLYRDPGGRFEVVSMAWGPGQSTPIHDHSGMWCVEGVYEGQIEVTRFDIKETPGDDLVRVEQLDVIRAGLGECGALIPPVEYHRIANPHDHTAVTIHIYGGMMRSCRVFEQAGGGAYRVSIKPLRFTSENGALPPA